MRTFISDLHSEASLQAETLIRVQAMLLDASVADASIIESTTHNGETLHQDAAIRDHGPVKFLVVRVAQMDRRLMFGMSLR
jgi:hypothetical protein